MQDVPARVGAASGCGGLVGVTGVTGDQHAVGLDGEGAARPVEAQDPDQLLVDVELAAGHAQRAGDGEEESLVCPGIAEDRVEHGRQESAAAEAAGLNRL